ncbi:MAG: hypothetical protein HKO59_01970 [Phycisphaerales bacterium]|nr:hypothetical protein [Phycisphaerae bacterium]NNF44039.1 hypothetical protein [Phycisphaerales bacterium]NNM24748.1 hypothetical protein [Phycisphaerales bacterium]
MKRNIPLLVAMIAGFVMIVAYFIPYTEDWGEVVGIWFDILAAIAFILGGGNLMKVHLSKVSDRAAGWAYSVITLAAFLFTLAVGLLKIGVPPNEMHPDQAWGGLYREIGSPFWWLFEYAFKPLTATMFAMLAFYVASAAFRAFRAKNFEAILLLGTAFIILLGRTAAGPFLTDWFPDAMSGLKADELSAYLMTVFNKAGNRAIMIGIALGTASVSLKILLGVDRSYLGSGEE